MLQHTATYYNNVCVLPPLPLSHTVPCLVTADGAASLSVLLAGAGMLVYLRLRFAPHFAWAALITLGLDLSKTLGFLVLTGLEFNLTTVAALLTLIAKREGVQSTTLIATQFDSLDGWDSYRSVTDHFEAPVYLLTPDIVQRFEIERLPSVITSDGKAFVVEELTKGSRP